MRGRKGRGKDPVATAFAKAVGFLVRKRRRELKLSHEQVAFVSGLSIHAVERIEEGERIPTLWTIHLLSIALRCVISSLTPRAPVINEHRRRRSMFVAPDGRVRRRGTGRRTMYYRKQAERGFKYPRGWPFIDPEFHARSRKQKTPKIKTRAEVKREKAAAVKKKSRGVQK